MGSGSGGISSVSVNCMVKFEKQKSYLFAECMLASMKIFLFSFIGSDFMNKDCINTSGIADKNISEINSYLYAKV